MELRRSRDCSENAGWENRQVAGLVRVSYRRLARRALEVHITTAHWMTHLPATGVTDYLTNGGKLEVARRMAGLKLQDGWLFDRMSEDMSLSKVEMNGN